MIGFRKPATYRTLLRITKCPVLSSALRDISINLGRYLDYCSELLSITSKIAALLVQDFDDPVVLGSVNEIETLTTGLSGKIWQKITILDRSSPARPSRPVPG